MTPFKVICVDDSPGKVTHMIPPFKIREMVVVTHVINNCYEINNDGYYWDSSRFRRLSEYPDATSEILKDFNPDKVEQEIVNPVKKVEV